MTPDPHTGAQVRRLRPRRSADAAPPLRRTGEARVGVVVTPPRYVLAHALTRSLGQPLVSGNRVELIRAGEPAWATLFDAIDHAREHVNLESPAFVAPALAAALAQRLMTRAGEGVRVNLLLDGSRCDAARDTALLRQAGIGVCESRWLPRARALLGRASRRHTQRSLIVIDGRLAFLGGLAPLRSAGAGACLRVEGPVVALLQKHFVAHWRRECGTAPPQARYFPALAPRGTQRTGLAACDAGWQMKPFQPALLVAIDAAQEHVLIGGAPERTVAVALAHAAARGVEVQVLLPPAPEADEGQAQRARYCALLRAGVRLHRRCHAPLQPDTCVIDGVWTAFGGALDFDRRPHEADLTLIVLDNDFGAGIERMLRDDFALCRELTAPEAEPADGAGTPADSRPAGSAWMRARQWLNERWPARS